MPGNVLQAIKNWMVGRPGNEATLSKSYMIGMSWNILVMLSYSRLQKSCNKQAEQWKTTIDLLCLNREVGHAEAGKIIIFICGKSIVVFHCFSLLVARLLQSAVELFAGFKSYLRSEV